MGFPCKASDEDFTLPRQEMQVRFLVRELRPHMPHGAAKTFLKREREKKCLFNKIYRNRVGTVEGMAARTPPAEIHVVAMGLTAKWQFPSAQLRAEDLTWVGGLAIEPVPPPKPLLPGCH